MYIQKGNSISTRQKLGALIKRFMKLMDDQKRQVFDLNFLINEGSRIFKDQKRAIDILFYFQALGLVLRISADHLIYLGFRGMIRKLYQHESGLNGQGQLCYDQINIAGKATSVRPQILAGQLLGRIFYGLIYQKQATNKSLIEQMVESFMYQQKEVNLKNFVPEILNILGIIGLIQKNEATQVITYIGPDLKCYDESLKKVSWKIFQLNKRQEIAIGRENEHIQQPIKLNSSAPTPVHMSFFPQLSYAVLRTSSWEKGIPNTVFFIGRTQKRTTITEKCKSYKVDLQLPYRSISRQHALILFNFEVQRWQIRCLSKKNLIKVDGQRFAYGDKNIWLRNKAQIQIGPEKMVFLQVSNPIE